MLRLLRADLYRAVRFKPFDILLACNAALAVAVVCYNYDFYRKGLADAFDVLWAGLGGGASFLGILSAILIGLFVGSDFSGGARGKLVVACGRAAFYLSKLAVGSLLCVLVYLSFHLFTFALAGPRYGWGGHTLREALLSFAMGIGIVLAYAAIHTSIAMFTRSTVATVLTGILLALLVLAASSMLYSPLQNGCIEFDPATGGMAEVECGWPEWVRALARFFLYWAPSAQSSLFGHGDPIPYALCMALSASWVLLSAVVGPLFFRKVSLK